MRLRAYLPAVHQLDNGTRRVEEAGSRPVGGASTTMKSKTCLPSWRLLSASFTFPMSRMSFSPGAVCVANSTAFVRISAREIVGMP